MDAYDVFVMRFESNVNRRYLPIPGLQRVFGIDQRTAEEIARNLPRAVKRRVTLDVAAQYAEALREIGAEVQLRPCQNDLGLSTHSTPPTAPASLPSSPPAASPSGTDESASAKQIQVGAFQAAPSNAGNATVAAGTLGEVGPNHSEQRSIETTDSRIPPQPSATTEPETPGLQTAQSAQQPVDDLSTGRSNGTEDDRLSRKSNRPSPDTGAYSLGSSRPLPLKQDEQNVAAARNVASPPVATPNPINLSQSAGNVLPNNANAVFDSNLSARASTAAQTKSAAYHTTSPLGYTPSSFPINTDSTEEPIPAEAIKKSFWAPGTGYVLAGSILILIGLSYDGSVFTGNAAITDYFFDALGVCWIVWGLFKLVKKRGSSRL